VHFVGFYYKKLLICFKLRAEVLSMFHGKVSAVAWHITLCNCISDTAGWIYSFETFYSQQAQVELPCSKPTVVCVYGQEVPNLA
jgi:hypothetical protein